MNYSRLLLPTTLLGAMTCATVASAQMKIGPQAVLKYVPSKALGVVLVNLQAQPKQNLAFALIDQLMAGQQQTNGSIAKKIFQDLPPQVASHIKFRTGALMLLPTDNILNIMNSLVFCAAFDDSPAVMKTWNSAGHFQFWKGARYKILKTGRVAMIHNHTITYASDKSSLPTLLNTINGGPNLAGNQEVQHALSKCDADANITLLINPRPFMSIFGAASGKNQLLSGAAKMAKWSSLDIAMRNQGIALNLNIDGLGSTTIMPNVGKMQMATSDLPADYQAYLPAGAYATLSVGKIGILGSITPDKNSKPFEKALNSLFTGNSSIGLYTQSGNGNGGADILLSFDHTIGHSLVALTQSVVSNVSKDKDEPVPFEILQNTSRYYSGRVPKSFADKFIQDLQSQLKGAGMNPHILDNKTLNFVATPTRAWVSTSQTLLNKAVALKPGSTSNMALDSGFKRADGEKKRRSTISLMIDVARIGKGITSFLDPSNDQAQSIKMISGFIEKWPAPLTLDLLLDKNQFNLHLFVPIDMNTVSILAAMAKR